MCVVDDGERCEVWHEINRRARKQHRCDCCHRAIEKGELYCSHFHVYKGTGSGQKCCEECDRDRKLFAAAPGHLDFPPADFAMVLSECLSESDDEDDQWKPMFNRIEAARAANKQEVLA